MKANSQKKEKKLTRKHYILFTLFNAIYFSIVGVVVFFLVFGSEISIYIAVGCISMMLIILLTYLLISILNLKNFSLQQRKFFRFYSLFLFISIPTIIFLNTTWINDRDSIYRLPFCLFILACLFASFTSIPIIVANRLGMTLYHENNTLIPKLAFDFLTAIPLGFIFSFLSEDFDNNYWIIFSVFTVVPFFIYLICGFMLLSIDRNAASAEVSQPVSEKSETNPQANES